MSNIRKLYQKFDQEVWAGNRYFSKSKGWVSDDVELKRHENLTRSDTQRGVSRLLKKAWPGSKATISNEVKCHHYSIDTVIEFRQKQNNVKKVSDEPVKKGFLQAKQTPLI